jgi:hypothetical protein
MTRPNARLDAQAILPHLDKEKDEQQLAKLTSYPLARVQRALTWAYEKGLVDNSIRFKGGNLVGTWTRKKGAKFPPVGTPRAKKKVAGPKAVKRGRTS